MVGNHTGIMRVLIIAVLLTTFIAPAFASKIVDIEQGSHSTFIVKDDGSVWSWGQNWGGILNDGTTTDRCVLGPTRIQDVKKLSISDCGIVLKTDGTVWTWGFNRRNVRGYETSDNLSYSPIPNLTNVKDIFTSNQNCFAIKNDGTVWAWGWNNNGALIQITGLPIDVVMMAPGGHHTLALDSQGMVWAWGVNSRGQLGDGTNIESYSQKKY